MQQFISVFKMNQKHVEQSLAQVRENQAQAAEFLQLMGGGAKAAKAAKRT